MELNQGSSMANSQPNVMDFSIEQCRPSSVSHEDASTLDIVEDPFLPVLSNAKKKRKRRQRLKLRLLLVWLVITC